MTDQRLVMSFPTAPDIRIPPPSLKFAYRWLLLGRAVPSRKLWSAVCSITSGRSIRYRGSRFSPPKICKNYDVTPDQQRHINERKNSDIEAGYLMRLGRSPPFCNFTTSPRFVRNNADGINRIIVDPTRSGINEKIDTDRPFHCASIDEVATAAEHLGQGVIMIKF